MFNEEIDFSKILKELSQKKGIPKKYCEIISAFFLDYQKALRSSPQDRAKYLQIFHTFLKLIEENIEHPFTFEAYHKSIRAPFDYYRFGIDFVRPLVDLANSSLEGAENVTAMTSFIKNKENVVLFSNHQTEAEPQLIALILEKDFPSFSENLTFVAGERVTSDPLAIPISMGCNLLCIYSKKYIDSIPELKAQKQLHNKKTMELMSSLFSKGGFAVYVAPSGGRDRPEKEGSVEVAPFDPQSIEMFYLMAKKAKTRTHFFPLALYTYDILPPPDEVQKEMGEERKAKRSPIHFSFGKEIDMEHFPGNTAEDKIERRKKRALYIHSLVAAAYKNIKKEIL